MNVQNWQAVKTANDNLMRIPSKASTDPQANMARYRAEDQQRATAQLYPQEQALWQQGQALKQSRSQAMMAYFNVNSQGVPQLQPYGTGSFANKALLGSQQAFTQGMGLMQNQQQMTQPQWGPTVANARRMAMEQFGDFEYQVAEGDQLASKRTFMSGFADMEVYSDGAAKGFDMTKAVLPGDTHDLSPLAHNALVASIVNSSNAQLVGEVKVGLLSDDPLQKVQSVAKGYMALKMGALQKSDLDPHEWQVLEMHAKRQGVYRGSRWAR